MPKPPFDVPIHCFLPPGPGIFRADLIAEGFLDGPDGPIKVMLGIDKPVVDGSPERPMQLVLLAGKHSANIDVTDMMQRIVNEPRRIRPTPDEIRTAQLVAADDGTVFRCSIAEVGRDRQWRWHFQALDGREYVGPVWFAVSPAELTALVNAWWEERKRFNNGETVEQLRDRIFRDMARDN